MPRNTLDSAHARWLGAAEPSPPMTWSPSDFAAWWVAAAGPREPDGYEDVDAPGHLVAGIWFIDGLRAAMRHPEWAQAVVALEDERARLGGWPEPEDIDELVAFLGVEGGKLRGEGLFS